MVVVIKLLGAMARMDDQRWIKTCTAEISSKIQQAETFNDLAALQQRMTAIDEADLFDIDDRRPYKLRLRAKADLMRGWLLYFIPWDVSTRWRDVRVKDLESKP